jgi:hypothetical protein
MDFPIKKLLVALLLKESVMALMGPACKTAEFQDGMIRTQSAEEDQEKRRRETASIDQELSLKNKVFVTELMDPACKTAEFQDGTTKTQSAEENQEKKKKETALIDQVLLLKKTQQPLNLHFHFATQCIHSQMLSADLQLNQQALLKKNQQPQNLHSHFAMECINTQMLSADLQ